MKEKALFEVVLSNVTALKDAFFKTNGGVGRWRILGNIEAHSTLLSLIDNSREEAKELRRFCFHATQELINEKSRNNEKAVDEIFETALRMGEIALSAPAPTKWSFLGIFCGLGVALEKLGDTERARKIEYISCFFFDPARRGEVEAFLKGDKAE